MLCLISRSKLARQAIAWAGGLHQVPGLHLRQKGVQTLDVRQRGDVVTVHGRVRQRSQHGDDPLLRVIQPVKDTAGTGQGGCGNPRRVARRRLDGASHCGQMRGCSLDQRQAGLHAGGNDLQQAERIAVERQAERPRLFALLVGQTTPDLVLDQRYGIVLGQAGQRHGVAVAPQQALLGAEQRRAVGQVVHEGRQLVTRQPDIIQDDEGPLVSQVAPQRFGRCGHERRRALIEGVEEPGQQVLARLAAVGEEHDAIRKATFRDTMGHMPQQGGLAQPRHAEELRGHLGRHVPQGALGLRGPVQHELHRARQQSHWRRHRLGHERGRGRVQEDGGTIGRANDDVVVAHHHLARHVAFDVDPDFLLGVDRDVARDLADGRPLDLDVRSRLADLHVAHRLAHPNLGRRSLFRCQGPGSGGQTRFRAAFGTESLAVGQGATARGTLGGNESSATGTVGCPFRQFALTAALADHVGFALPHGHLAARAGAGATARQQSATGDAARSSLRQATSPSDGGGRSLAANLPLHRHATPHHPPLSQPASESALERPTPPSARLAQDNSS